MSIEKSCWWQEGGRCYKEPVDRKADGRSKVLCSGKCGNFMPKREMLSQYIPNDKLIITSERKNGK
jgi:hypothetical protein